MRSFSAASIAPDCADPSGNRGRKPTGCGRRGSRAPGVGGPCTHRLMIWWALPALQRQRRRIVMRDLTSPWGRRSGSGTSDVDGAAAEFSEMLPLEVVTDEEQEVSWASARWRRGLSEASTDVDDAGSTSRRRRSTARSAVGGTCCASASLLMSRIWTIDARRRSARCALREVDRRRSRSFSRRDRLVMIRGAPAGGRSRSAAGATFSTCAERRGS